MRLATSLVLILFGLTAQAGTRVTGHVLGTDGKVPRTAQGSALPDG